ncbi:hypothetical protein QJ856_gp0258 [Tupanvirus deep ocean]|uniref:Uncharacterized protein n=2 Tax=Tupanvirus TaxID=2094720 RepID=A0AC62A9U0_9VIRU|nr:hypothetical protein QJ856_gp0258 [Tupanvirus deep ocean]QKU34474.1 hypothetical protein [Tupanvirus deep ocean]
MGNNVSFKKEFGLIIVGAVIFTASFLWKDLLSDVREIYFPKEYGIFGRLIFTIIITMLLVIFAIHLRNILGITQSNQDSSDTTIRFDDDPLGNPESVDIDFDFSGGQ